MGGEYRTWFIEEGSKERSLLYKIENMDIVRLHRETTKINNEKFYKYKWKLTENGQKLVDENKCLQKIWGDGKKIPVFKFYDKVVELMRTK